MHKLVVFALLLGSAAYAQKTKYTRSQDLKVEVKQTDRTKPARPKPKPTEDKPVITGEAALSIEGLKGTFQAQQEQILKDLIKDTPDSDVDQKADLYFRLGELQAKQHRFWRLEATRLSMTKGQEGAAKQAAEQAKDFLKRSVKTYMDMTTTDAFQNYPKMDVALFYFGYTLQNARYFKEARAAFDKLLKNYPNSKYVAEAHYAFGDYYFEAGQLADAEQRYLKVLEFPRSAVYWHAMYKLGWVHLNQGEHQQALERFYTVASAVKNDPKQEVLYRGARKDFVRAFAEVGKAERAYQAFQRLDGKRALDMLGILADLYLEQGKSEKAIFTYHELMRIAPRDKAVCNWQYNVTRAALSMPRTADSASSKIVVDEIDHLVRLYGSVKGKRVMPKPDEQECRDNAVAASGELARAYHSEFAKTKDPQALLNADKLYTAYLREFPDAPDYAQTQYYFAELLWTRADLEKNPRLSTELWEQAASAFIAVVKANKLEPRLMKEAAYAAVLGQKNALDIDPRIEKQVGQLDDLDKDYDKLPEPKPIPPKEQRLLDAFALYRTYIKDKNDDELVRIKFMEGNTYRRYNQLDKAIPWFEDILANHKTHETAEFAANLLLDSLNRQHRYKEMLAVAARLAADQEFLDGKADLSMRLAKLQIQRRRKDAEALEKKGRASKDFQVLVACGNAYLDIYNANPEAKENDQVLYNALVCFHEGKSVSAAIFAFNTLQRFYPDSKLMPRAVGRIGKAYGDVAYYEKSAEKLEEYAKKYAGEADAPLSMSDAVFYWKGLGKDDKAIEDTKYFVRMFGTRKPEIAANAHWSLATVYEKQGDTDALVKHLREYIAKYGAKYGADRLVMAHAKIGQALWAKSCPVKLVDGSCIEVARERAIRVRGKQTHLQTQCGPTSKIKLTVKSRDARLVKDAFAAFAKAKSEYENRNGKTGGDEAGARYFYAQARLAVADRAFEDYLAMAFPRGLDFDPKQPAVAKKNLDRFEAWLDDKRQVGGKAREQYEAILGLKDAATSIAAAARIGQISQNFSDALFTAEIPKNVRTGAFAEDKIEAFCDRMTEVGTPLEERSLEAFRTCLTKSTDLGWFSDWSKLCERELGQIRPDEFPTAAELRGDAKVATVITVEGPISRLE
jgi:tetratricopeptide (TPR) repeat protein